MSADNPPIPETISLRTPRLLLRPLRASDRAEFIRVEQVSRDVWVQWTSTPPADESLEQLFDRYLRMTRQGLEQRTHLRMVGESDRRRIIGFFSIADIVRGAFQSAYAGWRVSADATGTGYATEAVTGLLDLAFAPEPRGLGLHRVQANIIPTNAASLRVAEKVGLRREGLAERYLQIAGKWQDHVMFARTVEEHQFQYL